MTDFAPQPQSESSSITSRLQSLASAALTLGLLAAILSGAAGYLLGYKQGKAAQSEINPIIANSPAPTIPDGEAVACTMEAKVCPDGSAVGRSGPNCEFAACPGEGSATDDHADWQTFTYENVGIEIKIPQDWEMRNLTNPSDKSPAIFDMGFRPNTVKEDVAGIIRVKKMTLKEAIVEEQGMNKYTTVPYTEDIVTKTVQGYKATEIIKTVPQSNYAHGQLLIEKDGLVYSLTSNDSNEPLVAEIAQTFKFIQ